MNVLAASGRSLGGPVSEPLVCPALHSAACLTERDGTGHTQKGEIHIRFSTLEMTV